MNIVFIIPTGIGCSIGGHAGDATPAAKLIASTCDKLILHPNVVNASDINEMPSNALYVEGSILDSFLCGDIELQEVRSNKVLVVVNPPMKPETLNAINAAKATIGFNVEVVELSTALKMRGWIEDGVATGDFSGTNELIDQVTDHQFDALAIASPIEVPVGAALDYFRKTELSVNPWGGIEAKVSREIATAIRKPVAHAPIECDNTKHEKELYEILFNEVVDFRKAAEVCSNCYIHCILKGLHKAPRIGNGISRDSVGALVTPVGCIGPAHRACFEAGIPVIGVRNNETTSNEYDDRIIYVENYLEAAGVIGCMNAGITVRSVGSS